MKKGFILSVVGALLLLGVSVILFFAVRKYYEEKRRYEHYIKGMADKFVTHINSKTDDILMLSLPIIEKYLEDKKTPDLNSISANMHQMKFNFTDIESEKDFKHFLKYANYSSISVFMGKDDTNMLIIGKPESPFSAPGVNEHLNTVKLVQVVIYLPLKEILIIAEHLHQDLKDEDKFLYGSNKNKLFMNYVKIINSKDMESLQNQYKANDPKFKDSWKKLKTLVNLGYCPVPLRKNIHNTTGYLMRYYHYTAAKVFIDYLVTNKSRILDLDKKNNSPIKRNNEI